MVSPDQNGYRHFFDPLPSIRLRSVIAESINHTVPEDLSVIAEYLRERIEDVQAIIYYGSRLRDQDPTRMADLYVLTGTPVTDINRMARWAQKIISPLTFPLNAPGGLQAKYALLTTARFERGMKRAFHSYYWARFAQPCRLIYCHDTFTAERLVDCIAAAIEKMLNETIPLIKGEFSTRDLWVRALYETYKCELRPERDERIGRLYAAQRGWYEKITPAAMEIYAEQNAVRGKEYEGFSLYHVQREMISYFKQRGIWFVRRGFGKLLSCLRMIASILTFEDWRGYVEHKIMNHSGYQLQLVGKPYPEAGLELWRAWRSGAFR